VAGIKHVLNALDDLDSEAVERLFEMNDVCGRSRADMLRKLSRSYRGNEEAFYSDLRKKDVANILSETLEFNDGSKYRLPKPSSFSKEELAEMAVRAFVYDVVPDSFVPVGGRREVRASREPPRPSGYHGAYRTGYQEGRRQEPPPPPPRNPPPPPPPPRREEVKLHENEVFVMSMIALKLPATLAEIRSVRRRLAAILSPDINPGRPDAASMMVRANDGCDRLEKRATS
jgi:hypothetical protein